MLGKPMVRRMLFHPVFLWIAIVSAAFAAETLLRSEHEALANLPSRALAVGAAMIWTHRRSKRRMSSSKATELKS